MVEKDLRAGICHSIYQYSKAKNKYMKDFDENKESSELHYWDVYFIWLGNVAKASNK